MPVLKKIVISNFRNIEFQELEFSPNVNCICGDNGGGKTNLLDAIYYLSMTKSSFSPSDKYNFRHGTDNFSMCGTYRMQNGIDSKIAVSVSPDDKKVRRDDKPYQKISEHIGLLPTVMVTPSDSSLVSDSGEERRKFVNSVISQMDRGYLLSLQQYSRLLLERNRMLKSPDTDMDLLDVIDMRLDALAGPVREKRRKFVESLSPSVSSFYDALSPSGEKVSIEYSSDDDRGPLYEILKETRQRDMALKYTGAGPQRDDFIFRMDGYPIRRCGSQGQQKSFLVSLKFAQYDLMKQKCGFAPTLLLDDVFDKLDMARISNLVKMVASNDFGQIFITDTNQQRLQSVVDSVTADRKYFETREGTFDARQDN